MSDDMRAWVRDLFAAADDEHGAWGEKPDPEPSPEPITPSNYVPREGNQPTNPDPNRRMREFTAALFQRND